MPELVPRGVRKISEAVLQKGRAIILTEEDASKLAWDEIPDGSIKINVGYSLDEALKAAETKAKNAGHTLTEEERQEAYNNAMHSGGVMSIKLKGQSDWVPAGLKNDGTICIVKDARIVSEVFTIKLIDTEKNTFRYQNINGDYRDGKIVTNKDKTKMFVFRLEEDTYMPERNMLKVIYNDTLVRTAASGGLVEINTRDFGITDSLQIDDEITATYIAKLRIGNPYPRFFVGKNPPSKAEDCDLWLDTSDGPYESTIVNVTD